MTSLRLSRRTFLAGTAAIGLAGGLTGFQPQNARAAADPQRGGVLRYATLGLDTADPHRHTGSISVQQIYVEALTSIGDDGSVKPFLAESFSVSPDGKTYSFTLRDGVKFHNGEVMSAGDVVANITRVKEKVKGGWLASAMKLVDTATAPDARTVVIAMREPYAPLLNLMSELWILSPKSPGWDDTITTPIGTGPFTFGDWQPKVKLTAPAHTAYWRGGMPYLAAIEADLRDGADRQLALRAGEIDIASVPADIAKQLAKDPNLRVSQLKDAGWYFVAFNNRKPRPPFDDVRVRQALTYAIDKAAFINFASAGTGVVSNQMVGPGNLYFDEALFKADPHAKADLAKAKALLKEAGVDPTKETIEFVSWQESYPQVVVQMVRKLGFNVNHVALDDIGTQKRLGQYDWDMNCMDSGPRADIFLRYVRMMSDGPNPVLWGGIQDADYDALVKKAVAETDLSARRQLYLAAWKRVMDQYYVVALGLNADQIVIRKGVEGYEPGFTWSPNRVDGGVAQTWLAGRS
ncbi:ABC-type transport system substrate-binding protein [Angulomicrobium tetraedrale]|uniref:ABC-type transport system substrate-binding protein n=1 Tax=Ancylobacter tetraedralis TaxID=217068 RepID=A0A839Z7W2_9HYPH|nr:ABC transporter substrate-binding protein [Ancylobacter tetraedralis]MBB3771263.1 ABC-type transport system substrate-binding protein [Ancylobacter tetraedralis]